MHLVLLKAVYEPVHCQQLISRRKVLSNRTSAACHLHGGGVVSFVFVTGGAPPVSVASHILAKKKPEPKQILTRSITDCKLHELKRDLK